MAPDLGRVKPLFLAALDLPDAPARAAFLAQECTDDSELRQRVEALLRAHDDPAAVLERPLAELAVATDSFDLGLLDESLAARARTAVGTIIAERYKLLELIGEGGMGEVWVADQLAPIRRRVALKVIKPGMDSRSILARFEAERQALALMDDPNIAKVLDAGAAEDGRPFFVMELVKGTPITTFCDARKLRPAERLALFIPVCKAIQHAHQKGIIHRDIKPTNILVELHDERVVPKVIDFGVAKAVGQQLTEKTLYTGFGALVGTPTYMAPEQAAFNAMDVDTRADVYALGVVLYELLTGSPPVEPERFKRVALDEVLRLVRDEEPPTPSQRLSTATARASIAAARQSDPDKLARVFRGELDWIVMKALEKDRNRRYETAAGLAKDIERYLQDEPVEACPPTLSYRARKAFRKHRAALATATAFALVLVLATALSGWQAWRAQRAREAALDARRVAEAARAQAVDQEHIARQQRDAAVAVGLRLEAARQELRSAAYLADMQALPLAWDLGNVARAQEILERNRPVASAGPDLRRFEWFYWDRQLHAERRHLRLPAQPAAAPGWAFSADGTRVLTLVTAIPHSAASSQPEALDQVLRIWDTGSGQEVMTRVLETVPGRAQLSTAKFSGDNGRVALSWGTEQRPAEGERALSGIVYRRVRVLDVATGETRVDFAEPEVDVERWELSADGRRFAVVTRSARARSGGPQVRVWDVDSGHQVAAVAGGADGDFGPPFSPDGSKLAVFQYADGSWNARIHTAADGREVAGWKTPAGRPPVAAWSPDGQRLAAVLRDAGDDQAAWTLAIWDAASGNQLYRLDPPPAVGARAAQFSVWFSPDGARLAVAGGSRGTTRGPEVRVYDPAAGQMLFSFAAHGPRDVHTFSHDGRWLASAEANTLLIRDTTSGRIAQTIRGPLTPVVACAFAADDHTIRGIEVDGTLKEWDLRTQIPVQISGTDRPGEGDIVLSQDGTKLAAIALETRADGKAQLVVLVYDASNGGVLQRHLLAAREPRDRFTCCLAFSGDGRRLALVQTRRGWNLRAGGNLPVHACKLTLWDADAGDELAEFPLPKDSYVALALNSAGDQAALCTEGARQYAGGSSSLRVFAIPSGQDLLEKPVPGLSSTVAFSPDGSRLAGAVALPLPDAWTPGAMAVKVWAVADGAELVSVDFDGHGLSPTWSRNGETLAVGYQAHSGTGWLKLLDARSGQVQLAIEDSAGASGNRSVGAPAFSPDGTRVAAHLGGPAFVTRAESEVKIWETTGGRELLPLPSSIAARGVLAFSRDGEKLLEAGFPAASGGRGTRRDTQIMVWSAARRAERIQP